MSRENVNKNLILFIFNRNKEPNYNRTHIVDSLDKITLEGFKSLVLKNMDTNNLVSNVNNISNKRNSNLNKESQSMNSKNSLKKEFKDTDFGYIDENNIDYNRISEADLIEIQKRQLEALEKEDSMKKIQEEKKKQEELKLKKEAEEKLKKEQELKDEKRKTLPPEPSEDNKEASKIMFRYPHTEQRVERRFMKTDKISSLYDFVCTLGTEIFEESGEFELITPFPFKIYSNKDKTLVEEGLFPNAVLQIREV
jgi:hypothetical protein